MAKKRLNPLVKRSRTRLGCLTCRDRHMKCDEQHPVCKNCIKLKRKCYRGIRLNFTQYTIYNPMAPPQPPHDELYRILDQLITIALLYKNGRRQYQPYLHLHTAQDLHDADQHYNDAHLPEILAPPPLVGPLLAARDILWWDSNSRAATTGPSMAPMAASMAPQMALHALPLAPLAPLAPMPHYDLAGEAGAPRDPLIGENYAITLELLKPLPRPRVPVLGLELAHQALAEGRNVFDYINLVELERYAWLLDLFNEMEVWGHQVPHYCLQQHQGDDGQAEPFLFDALLHCLAKLVQNVLAIQSHQLRLFQQLHMHPPPPPAPLELLVHHDLERDICQLQSARSFDKKVTDLVLLIALVLLSLVRKPVLLPSDCALAFNQGRLYDLCVGLIPVPASLTIMVSCIQLVLILKFFITKKFGMPPMAPGGAIADPASVRMDHAVPEGALFTLSDYEIGHLNLGFALAAFDQLNHHYQPDASQLLDLAKLRRILWQVIKADHLAHYPAELLKVDLEEPQELFDQPQNNFDMPAALLRIDEYYPPPLLLLNTRGIAINLLREHSHALGHPHNPAIINNCRYRCQFIFRMIDELLMDPEVKRLWVANFSWIAT